MDGKECLDYTDTTGLKKGLIGLQFREGKVAFRNIKLRPVGESILPGKKEEFLAPVKVEASWGSDGSLTIVGGRGHVETKRQLGNGFIQFAATTLTANVNSGVFFRCIPGEDMNGYECQLHHGFKSDRTDPVDSGTGAIFRRQAHGQSCPTKVKRRSSRSLLKAHASLLGCTVSKSWIGRILVKQTLIHGVDCELSQAV